MSAHGRCPGAAILAGLIAALLASAAPGFAQPWAVPERPARDRRGQDPPARFAIVIGNNVPDSERASTLRYADDDAVATHRVLVAAGVDSRLLVRLDEASARLHAGLHAHGPPTWAALVAALDELNQAMEAAAARGQRTELLLFYSGHGDVLNGEGYIVLEDRQLTRTLLYEGVLARSAAHGNHVIVDACKSYFLVFEKGPGGRRARYRGSFARAAVPGRMTNTGFLLSTSSDGDSHEWERYQAGVFSHEVRSGLRGAADIDRDGRITYAELGAFLMTANQAIANPRYRPDFSVHPPGEPPGELSRGLLSWELDGQALLVDDPDVGRVYVESATGERLADVHVAPGHAVALHVPAGRPLFVRGHDDATEYVVRAGGPLRVSALAAEPPLVARKGALHLAFEQLFAEPFDPGKVEAFEQRFRARATEPPEALEPTADRAPRDDAEPGGEPEVSQGGAPTRAPDPSRGEDPAPAPAEQAPPVPAFARRTAPASALRARVRTIAGWTGVGAAVLGVATGLAAAERYYGGRDASQVERMRRNARIHDLRAASLVLGGVAGAAAATWLATVLWPEGQGDRPGLVLAPAAGASGIALWFESAW